MHYKNILLTYYLKNNGNWDEIFESLRRKDSVDLVENYEHNFYTLMCDVYPKRLKECYKPPFVVFYKGIETLLNKYNYTFLLGKNVFNVPTNDVVETTKDKVNIAGGVVELWGANWEENFKIALGYCDKIVITKEIKNGSKEIRLIELALQMGINIYVKPTEHESFNNKLIKEGAFLIDSNKDLLP